jgi:hypothetical protein
MTFSDLEPHSKTVPVELPNGAVVKVEVASTESTGREDASSVPTKQFQPVAKAIEGIVQMLAEPIQKAKPKKATIKFGMEVAIESGQLTAVIVKGSGKANLEITLEWEPSDKGEP